MTGEVTQVITCEITHIYKNEGLEAMQSLTEEQLRKIAAAIKDTLDADHAQVLKIQNFILQKQAIVES